MFRKQLANELVPDGLSFSADALALEGFIDGLAIDTVIPAPTIEVGAASDERCADHVVKIVASDDRNRDFVPDLVNHMVKNTPKQVRLEEDQIPIIAALKEALRLRRVSMRALSERIGVPYRSLQNYFSGESRLPADVLLRICSEIGLEADYLAKGSFEISHEELYDAVHRVFRDILPFIEIREGHALGLKAAPAADRGEVLTAAHILTVRLNEAYAEFRKEVFASDRLLKPYTSDEKQRGELARKKLRV